MIELRWKIWLEKDGAAIFGDGRAALLEAIERTGSLSAAARELQIPYRSAWKHVNHMERAYGKKILDRRTGGATGGGCRLTDAGQRLLHGYLKFREGIDELLSERFRRFVDTA